MDKQQDFEQAILELLQKYGLRESLLEKINIIIFCEELPVIKYQIKNLIFKWYKSIVINAEDKITFEKELLKILRKFKLLGKNTLIQSINLKFQIYEIPEITVNSLFWEEEK